MTNLFVDRSFTSHSGLRLPFKIDCDALTDASLDTLARWYASRQQYCVVHAVPTGGERFASALRRYVHPVSKFGLVVDDVLTTGASMEAERAQWPEQSHWLIVGVVIFARGPCPEWVTPLFRAWPG